MANTKIGAPNWIESIIATWVDNYTLGSWRASYPISNIGDPDFGHVAESTDATTASTQFGLDFHIILHTLLSSAIGADAFVIPKHNLTQSALIRVKAGSAAFTADGGGGGVSAYDSGWVAALPAIVYPPGVIAWGHLNTWTGAPDPIMDAAYNRAVVVQFGSTIVADYWWVGINDTTNPDGFVSLARAMLVPFYQPTINFDYGFNIDFAGQRTEDIALGGQRLVDPSYPLGRIASLNFQSLPDDELVSILTALQTYLGFSRQGFFLYDPDDTYHMQRQSFAFIQLKPGAIVRPSWRVASSQLVLAEVL